MEYIIISTKDVESYLEDGWELHGGPCVGWETRNGNYGPYKEVCFYQEMVKEAR